MEEVIHEVLVFLTAPGQFLRLVFYLGGWIAGTGAVLSREPAGISILWTAGDGPGMDLATDWHLGSTIRDLQRRTADRHGKQFHEQLRR